VARASFHHVERRRELHRALLIWLGLWPVVALGYPIAAGAGGAQEERDLVIIGGVMAIGWLLPLAVIWISWFRGKYDLVQPLFGWLALPLLACLLFLPYLSRTVRQELPLVPRRSRQP
jgi:hypothetical protein